jgi:hypothetical protein
VYDSDCTGTSFVGGDGKTYRYAEECHCGYSSLGYAYCALFPGDAAVMAFTALDRDWIGGESITACNTMRRYSDECIEGVGGV